MRRSRRVPAEVLGALKVARRAHRGASPAATAEGRYLRGCTWASARLALDGDRGRRPLCAGRHGELSEFGADECGAGKGRRRQRIVMVVPATRRRRSIRRCSRPPSIAGVEEIYRIGGAQAIAALAYGTETIAPVAKIIGPGNAYVAAAKRQVFGTVGIDMIAGPSEVLVIADTDNNPDWIAADLLAQAEHDAGAQAILITDDAPFAKAVEAAVERQLTHLAARRTAAASWRDFGAVILVPDLAGRGAARQPHRRRTSGTGVGRCRYA